jgi:hypothetical protein
MGNTEMFLLQLLPNHPPTHGSGLTKKLWKNSLPRSKLEAIPVRVVKLSDAEAIEAQVVELSVVGKIFLC